jgi:hypothetical protein
MANPEFRIQEFRQAKRLSVLSGTGHRSPKKTLATNWLPESPKPLFIGREATGHGPPLTSDPSILTPEFWLLTPDS